MATRWEETFSSTRRRKSGIQLPMSLMASPPDGYEEYRDYFLVLYCSQFVFVFVLFLDIFFLSHSFLFFPLNHNPIHQKWRVKKLTLPFLQKNRNQDVCFLWERKSTFCFCCRLSFPLVVLMLLPRTELTVLSSIIIVNVAKSKIRKLMSEKRKEKKRSLFLFVQYGKIITISSLYTPSLCPC